MTDVIKGVLTAIGAAVLLTACASRGMTPYGPADSDGYGYRETRIERDRFNVVFAGDSGTPPGVVENYALLRAAELSLENGYDWFRVVRRFVEPSTRGGVNVGGGVGSGSFGRRGGVGVGVGGDFGTVGARTYFTARLDVLMGRGEKPGEANAYDARSLVESLGATAHAAATDE